MAKILLLFFFLLLHSKFLSSGRKLSRRYHEHEKTVGGAVRSSWTDCQSQSLWRGGRVGRARVRLFEIRNGQLVNCQVSFSFNILLKCFFFLSFFSRRHVISGGSVAGALEWCFWILMRVRLHLSEITNSLIMAGGNVSDDYSLWWSENSHHTLKLLGRVS